MDCAGDVRAAYPLFQAGSGGASPTPALWFSKIDQRLAVRLNRLWHSRFPQFGGGGSRICYGAEIGGRWCATAIWTNPSSPKLPQTAWLMLKRYALSPDAPRHAAGRMMGWMVRDVRRRFPDVTTMVSYSDPATHLGTIYKATGWTAESRTRRAGIMWHNRPRDHAVNEPCREVVRWILNLK